ncbi:hypothetical protein ACSX1A_13340 [Pontibacter sp. MBLB2868]|uniref:hypothetical protein n=1 Tax=Pontibacter sp. MBLB2868 TaxID=3451555 RepID=UPI003F755DE0
MKTKKIRGHRRRHKQIRKWVLHTLPLDLDVLSKWQREYAEILVHPWSGISITESVIPEPKGKTKALMLEGLLEIYQSWKVELEKLGTPYYLKLWLYEQRFSKSQVVCAIGEKIEYYQNSHRLANIKREFEGRAYGALADKLSKYSWELALDDEIHTESEYSAEPEVYAKYEYWLWDQRQFKKIKNNPKTTIIEGDEEPLYCVTKGFVWLGGVK